MPDDQLTFGDLLRAARLRAGFHTITAFADHLNALDLAYTDEAIGHWERDSRKPSREILLQVLRALAEAGGITEIGEVNHMLWLLGWRNLDSHEQQAHFAGLDVHPLLVNLPPQPYDLLVGRDAAVEALASRLLDPADNAIIVLSGLGGIGKTAIAYEVVKQVMAAGRFDGLAWECARSEEFVGVQVRVRRAQALDWSGVLASIARQLGLDALVLLPLDELQVRLRGILRASSFLIVLDNLESLDAARDVAYKLHGLVTPPGTDRPSRVLITSRERLADEPFVFDHFVAGLSEPDTLRLLEFEAQQRQNCIVVLRAGQPDLVVDFSQQVQGVFVHGHCLIKLECCDQLCCQSARELSLQVDVA